MRTIDELPLPSFTTMSFELQKDSLRLPTYRESILVRFHPYPQTRRKNVANPLMVSAPGQSPVVSITNLIVAARISSKRSIIGHNRRRPWNSGRSVP